VITITERRVMELYGGKFCRLLEFSWNEFKLDCYDFRMLNVIPMVTIKKISIKYIQKKMRRQLNILLQKSIQYKRRQYWRK